MQSQQSDTLFFGYLALCELSFLTFRGSTELPRTHSSSSFITHLLRFHDLKLQSSLLYSSVLFITDRLFGRWPIIHQTTTSFMRHLAFLVSLWRHLQKRPIFCPLPLHAEAKATTIDSKSQRIRSSLILLPDLLYCLPGIDPQWLKQHRCVWKDTTSSPKAAPGLIKKR